MRTILIPAVILMALTLSGCATIAGTVTGAPFGAIDAPAETYRQNKGSFEEFPLFYALDVLVIGPVGFVTGPVFGFCKGLSLDIQWCTGKVDYSDVFGSYERMSIWRPHTVQWPSKPDRD